MRYSLLQRAAIIAKRLTEFCEERKLSIEAVQLPGAMNEEADKESRSGSDASD